MMTRVAIGPEILGWARERSRLPPATLKRRFPKFGQWESGKAQPTLKQVEALAKATHTPIGYFFLPKPIVEQLPLPDFRTIRNAPLGRPSPVIRSAEPFRLSQTAIAGLSGRAAAARASLARTCW